MSNIKFVSIETNINKNVEKKLLQSCRKFNIDIDIIGKGVDWKGFVTKFEIIIDYLKTIDSKLVCLTDSRDVLYMSDSQTIYDTFIKNFSEDSILFNGETQCFPEPNDAEKHPNQHKKYKYLNSGCVIGNRELLLKVCEDAVKVYKKTKRNDDQFLIQQIFLSGKYGDKFTLDYDCKIFQCVWDNDWGRSNNFDLIYTKDDIYNRLTDTHPLIFHFPGPTTTDSQVWKILNGTYYSSTQNNFF